MGLVLSSKASNAAIASSSTSESELTSSNKPMDRSRRACRDFDTCSGISIGCAVLLVVAVVAVMVDVGSAEGNDLVAMLETIGEIVRWT